MIQPAPTPPAVVTTCRVAADPAGREWSLAREGPSESPNWVLLFRRGTAASTPVRLPLPSAAPTVSAASVDLEFHSANGGRSVTLSAGASGPSRLDVFVNFELAVNVERDLDRAVDAMNTEGPITVTCTFAAPPGPPRQDEWMAGVGAAWSIDLLQSAGGRQYVPVSVSWGRDVMRDAGPGILRGRLMWAVELMPVYWQRQPTATVGIGLSPLVWRWRFAPRARAAPFAELAFGGLFTDDSVPEGTEAANFIAHGGFGVRWRPASRLSLVTAYRFQHISNGNQLTTNPGVNAHVVWVGVALGARAPG
jgi:Lipid A 3-O-deacylase (PagL)